MSNAPTIETADPVRFSAVLTPHRSLSRRGFLILMAVVGVVSFAAGMAFLMMGAWPVFGFLGLDAALVYFAFKRNYADARLCETVSLTDRELVVRRTAPRAEPCEWRFASYWVRVELEENERLEMCGPLFLASHGQRLEIGAFLGPGERRHLAEALKGALGRA